MALEEEERRRRRECVAEESQAITHSVNPEHCVSQSGLFFGRALEREADWQLASSDAPLYEYDWMSTCTSS